MTIDAATLLAAIETQLLTALARGATIVETRAFRIHLWPSPDPFYRNVALPVRQPADWQSAIAEMVAAFARAGRAARLEFLEQRWPELAAALVAAGLRQEPPQTVMVCTGRPPSAPGPAVTVLGKAAVAPGFAARYLEALHEAFEQPLESATLADEAARLERDVAAGACIVAAITDEDGRMVAGGSLIGAVPPESSARPVAELAGVWTAREWRRRGLASRATAALLDRFLAGGRSLVWLSAESERTAALYARLGFRPIDRQHTFVGTARGRPGGPEGSAA
jgi:ribosomal protein S18 acetylase RimI-like enzyme